MALLTESERALRFRVYRNGDDRYTGKYFVLNRRRIRTWDSFLQAVTLDVKSTDAVRSIRTPTHGSRIESLDQLAQDQKYVAVGNGRFKKLGYLNLEEHLQSLKTLSPRSLEQVKPVVHSRLKVPGRISSITTEVICIRVFANGLELEPAHRVKLKKGMLNQLPVVLAEINEKIGHLTGAVIKLYTLDGQPVLNADDMKSGDMFVAAGREIRFFRKLPYGCNKPAFNNSPKQQPSSRGFLPALQRRRTYRSRFSSNHTLTTASRSQPTGLDSVTSPGSSEKSQNRSSVAANERVPKPPHRVSPKKEEDTIFHAKPVKYRRSSDKKQDQVDYDKDDGGVFRATSKQENAIEVEDSKDTKVDRPIDQLEAEEVKDEVIEVESPPKRKKSQPRKSVSEPQNTRHPTPEESHKKRGNRKKEEHRVERTEERRDETPSSVPDGQDQDVAATRIQASYRGYKTRSKAKKGEEEKPREQDAGDEDEAKKQAAVKIQSSYRGYRSRKNVRATKEETSEGQGDEQGDAEMENAATKIQSNYRGYKTRKRIKEQNDAAVKIQSSYRGYQTRREVQLPPAETKKTEDVLSKQG